MTALQSELLEFRRQLYRPPPRQTVVEWAESNITLSRRQTEFPGPFTTSIRPYMRKPIECWRDRTVSEVILCWGSQTAKTTALMVGAVWSICEDPGPMLWILPSEHLARSFSKSRWRPMLDDSPAALQELPESRYDITHLEQHFRSCTLTFVGSNSPSNLSMRAIRTLIADEVDKFPDPLGDEADALLLAEQRQKTFSSSRTFLTSTPTVTEGRIWQRFLQGNREYYHVPCPHCGKLIRLLWKQVKWDGSARVAAGEWDLTKVQRSAHYDCQECGQAITDAQKVRALRAGNWFAENPGGAPGVVSFHLSSLYSPDRKCTWGNLAVSFLREKASLLGLQGFVNGTLAEPWTEQNFANKSRRTELMAIDGGPVTASIRLMTVDVQAVSPMFWAVVREWGSQGHSRLVFAGHCDTWEDISRIQLAHEVAPHRVIIDSGFNAQEVYQRCLAHSKVIPRPPASSLVIGWLPSKGRAGRLTWADRTGRKPSPYFIGKASLPPNLRLELPLAEYDMEALRDILARLRRGERDAPRWEVVPMPAGVETVGVRRVEEKEYWMHLDSWRRKSRVDPRRGKIVVEWASILNRVADHLLDCELLQILGAMIHAKLTLTVDEKAGALTLQGPTPEAAQGSVPSDK